VLLSRAGTPVVITSDNIFLSIFDHVPLSLPRRSPLKWVWRIN